MKLLRPTHPYVRLAEAFVYLAVVIDAFSRRVVGWALDDHLEARLAVDALGQAIDARDPPPGLIHHSDRGVQYASSEYAARLDERGFQRSMSRPGNPYDNAKAESFMKTLKAELRMGGPAASCGLPRNGRRNPLKRLNSRKEMSLDFPSLRLGFSFPRFAQRENSAAPRNSMSNHVNSTCVNAMGAWRRGPCSFEEFTQDLKGFRPLPQLPR